MVLLRRFLVTLGLLFWQGGFMFYGAVTVPIMRSIFDSETSFATQRITAWINIAGTAAILMMFIDVFASSAPKRGRWLTWLAMALPHPVLFWMHREMSAQMLQTGFRPSLEGFMANWHRIYLGLSTLQWLAGMIFIWLSLKAWRDEDRPLAALR
jgi:hypothetical protein